MDQPKATNVTEVKPAAAAPAPAPAAPATATTTQKATETLNVAAAQTEAVQQKARELLNARIERQENCIPAHELRFLAATIASGCNWHIESPEGIARRAVDLARMITREVAALDTQDGVPIS